MTRMTFDERLSRRKLRTEIYGVRNHVVMSKPPHTIGVSITTTSYVYFSNKLTQTIKTKSITFTKTFLSINKNTAIQVQEKNYYIPEVVKLDKPEIFAIDNISKERITVDDEFIEVIGYMFDEVGKG